MYSHVLRTSPHFLQCSNQMRQLALAKQNITTMPLRKSVDCAQQTRIVGEATRHLILVPQILSQIKAAVTSQNASATTAILAITCSAVYAELVPILCSMILKTATNAKQEPSVLVWVKQALLCVVHVPLEHGQILWQQSIQEHVRYVSRVNIQKSQRQS